MINTDQLFNLAIIFGVIQIFWYGAEGGEYFKGAWFLAFVIHHWLAGFTDRTGCSVTG
jgi:hypothetical protein